MNKEKLILSVPEAREILWGDSENYKIIENKFISNSRWSNHYRLVLRRKSDSKFFAGGYSEAASDSQEERPFENSEPIFEEVFPVEKTIIVYE